MNILKGSKIITEQEEDDHTLSENSPINNLTLKQKKVPIYITKVKSENEISNASIQLS